MSGQTSEPLDSPRMNAGGLLDVHPERRLPPRLERRGGKRRRTGKEMGRYFGTKGPAVSEVIKGIEGWWDEEIQPSKEIESLRGKIIIEF